MRLLAAAGSSSPFGWWEIAGCGLYRAWCGAFVVTARRHSMGRNQQLMAADLPTACCGAGALSEPRSMECLNVGLRMAVAPKAPYRVGTSFAQCGSGF